MGGASWRQVDRAGDRPQNRRSADTRPHKRICVKMSGKRSNESKAERIGAAVVGILFIGVALLILALMPADTTWYHIAALIVAGLGLDAIVSAIRARRPLLSRIGPLP